MTPISLLKRSRSLSTDPEDWRERGGRIGIGMGGHDKPGGVGGTGEAPVVLTAENKHLPAV